MADKFNITVRLGVMDAPCKDCTERKLRCHSSCDSYIAYRKYLDETKIAAKHDTKLTQDVMYATGKWVNYSDRGSVARRKRIDRAKQRNHWKN